MELGVERLPKTLSEALARFLADQELMEQFGETRARTYLAVKRAEIKALQDLPLEEEVQLLATKY